MTDFEITSFFDARYAGLKARDAAREMGFCESDQIKIAISVSELATNIVKYAGRGEVTLEGNSEGITIIAQDQGPGIKNIEMAFKDDCSDTKFLLDDDFRHHDGLGAGLPAVKRLMDEVRVLFTGDTGTVIKAEKYLHRPQKQKLHYGAVV